MSKRSIFKKAFIALLVVFSVLLIPVTKANAFTLDVTPTGISVTYYDDIDSRGFAWQTSTNVTETKLLYIKDEGQTINWEDATVVTGSYVDFNDFRCHKAHVTDLAGGKYLYKVGGNGSYSTVGSFIIDDSNPDSDVDCESVT